VLLGGVGALEGSIFGSMSAVSTVLGSKVEAALSAVLPVGTLLVPVEVKISGGRDDHGVTNPFPSTAVLGDQFARGEIPLWAILAKFGGGKLTAEDEWCSVGSRPCVCACVCACVCGWVCGWVCNCVCDWEVGGIAGATLGPAVPLGPE
jgi:cobalamin synthase